MPLIVKFFGKFSVKSNLETNPDLHYTDYFRSLYLVLLLKIFTHFEAEVLLCLMYISLGATIYR